MPVDRLRQIRGSRATASSPAGKIPPHPRSPRTCGVDSAKGREEGTRGLLEKLAAELDRSA